MLIYASTKSSLSTDHKKYLKCYYEKHENSKGLCPAKGNY